MPVDEAKVAEIANTLKEREEIIRESWVKAMEIRLVREELAKCHDAEGVNHYENCQWLSQKYLSLLRTNRVSGYKKIDV
ncbi:hypothetical protein D9613_007887 [Agrocybe pediades]|uniref:NADH-ubiquinone oxidoreductase 12 kDa subunit n=1 Tax=Agrocybe pediades TaxID=84607 RepID=A0A8H4VKX5_9AGAR|nr:hypothetical protein D9613_007887 [Agrocybe pediades]